MFNPLNLLSKIIKNSNQNELERIQKVVEKINDLEKDVKKLDNIEFPNRTANLVEKLKNGKEIYEILPEAFALAREASKRINNERHFDVQLTGGIVLNENKIAEAKSSA